MFRGLCLIPKYPPDHFIPRVSQGGITGTNLVIFRSNNIQSCSIVEYAEDSSLSKEKCTY